MRWTRRQRHTGTGQAGWASPRAAGAAARAGSVPPCVAHAPRAAALAPQPLLALKVLLPAAGRDARALRDFAEEVALLSSLLHPNIVHCYGTGLCGVLPNSVPFLAMEAMTGGDLRALVTRATMEPGAYNSHDIVRWSCQIAGALDYLHSREPKIIYRDMKLENVMLDGAPVPTHPTATMRAC
jgi:serine/threonine protein kinase